MHLDPNDRKENPDGGNNREIKYEDIVKSVKDMILYSATNLPKRGEALKTLITQRKSEVNKC